MPWELNMLLKNKKVTNRRTINTKTVNMQAINIKYEPNSLNKLKKVSNAPANIINFLDNHINKLNTARPLVISDNIKKITKKLFNKLHIEINSGNTITKKTHIKVFNNVPKQIESIDNTYYYYDKHKKLFNNVLKQIIEVNKAHRQPNNAFIDLNKCKEEHKKLFINVLNELKSNNNVHIQKNAGHKDSSANIINEMYTHDIHKVPIQKSVEDKEPSTNIINDVHIHDINQVPIKKTVNINNMHTNDINEVPMQKI